MDLMERIARLSPEQRRMFEAKLKKRDLDIFQLPIMPVTGAERHRVPLSFAQERLWFIKQFEPGNVAYNIIVACKLDGHLDASILEKSVNEIIRRHESLRTVFTNEEGQPVQDVRPSLWLPLEQVDLSQVHPNQQESQVKRMIREGNLFSFDLANGPLLKTKLMILGPTQSVFLLVTHHTIFDGASIQLFVREVGQLYEAFSQGQSSPLEELPIQYIDYARWLRDWFQPAADETGFMKRQEAYWLEQFRDKVPILNLPLDYPRPVMYSFEGNNLQTCLDSSTTLNLKQLARKENVTLYTLMLAIFYVFLAELSGEEDIVVGTPTAGRKHPLLRDLIGMFVNTLALRNFPLGKLPFPAFLAEVKQRTLEAFDNQEYRFEDIVSKVDITRDPGRNPIFDVMFVYQNFEFFDIDLPAVRLTPYDYETATTMFDIIFKAWEEGDILRVVIEYRSKLFKMETIQRFIAYFHTLAQSVLDSPQRLICDLDVIPPQEREILLHHFNDTGAPFPAEKTVHQLFEEQVARTPGHVALTGMAAGALGLEPGEQAVLTYAELNGMANRVARVLRQKGARPDVIIGFMVQRSLEMITGLLAILKAGAAYLPLDLEYPQERLDYIVTDCEMKIVVTNFSKAPLGSAAGTDSGAAPLWPGVEMVDLRDDRLYGGDGSNPGYDSKPSDLLYIIYTSGSTGKPKGLLVPHTTQVNFLTFCFHSTNLDFSSNLQFTTISFDISFLETFSAFFTGGKLWLIDEDSRTDIPTLLHLVGKYNIKSLFLPISFLKVIFNTDSYLKMFPRCIAHLEGAGEQLVVSSSFRRYLQENHVYLHNHYGPSEAHVITTLTLDPRGDIPELPTIGKPVANTKIYIMDKNDRLQPIGVPGELILDSVQVCRGYLNRPELTAEKFIKQKFSTTLYRTGDLCRWLPEGNLEFLGRIDFQVKIRGFRVELGEIESLLLQHEQVDDALVFVKTDSSGDHYLCAYLVARQASTDSYSQLANQLREYVSEELPPYMVPAHFVILPGFPLTPGGKIDRKALPEPTPVTYSETVDYSPPRTPLEKKMVDLWAEVLGVAKEQIGIDTDFFEVGGHSLKATILISRVYKELHMKLPLAEFFRSSTVRELSEFLTASYPAATDLRQESPGEIKEHEYEAIPAVPQQPYYELSSAQERFFIMQQMDEHSTALNMPGVFRVEGVLEPARVQAAFHALIQRQESLRTSFHMIEGQSVQKIHPAETIDFNIEFHECEAGDKRVEMPSLLQQFIAPFDLSRAPLFRVKIFRESPTRHFVFFDMHHIIADGISLLIFQHEFAAFYRQDNSHLEPLRIQYKDYASWQKSSLNAETLQTLQAYWLDRLSGFTLTRFPAPGKKVASRQEDASGFKQNFIIDETRCRRIEMFAVQHKVTKFVWMLTVFDLLLSLELGQTDITVGIPFANRDHEDVKRIIGVFLNVLLTRSQIEPHASFLTNLSKVSRDVLAAFDHSAYPYELLNQAAREKLGIKESQLFTIMFNYFQEETERKDSADNDFFRTGIVPVAGSPGSSPAIRIQSIDIEEVSPKNDLTFYVRDTGKKIEVTMVCKPEIVGDYRIRRIPVNFLKIIDAVLDDENAIVTGLDLVDETGAAAGDFAGDMDENFDNDDLI